MFWAFRPTCKYHPIKNIARPTAKGPRVKKKSVVGSLGTENLFAETVGHNASAASPRVVARLTYVVVRTLFASVAVTKYRRCSAAVARDACVITEVRGALFLDFLFLGFYGRVALGCHF